MAAVDGEDHVSQAAGVTVASAPRSSGGAREVLRHRDFALFWGAAIVSNSASWMQTVAIAAHVWDETESAAWLGAVGLASLIPATLLTPYAGVLADRLPRRLILGVTQTLQMLFAFLFFAVYRAGLLTPGRLLVLLALNGIVSGLQLASWQSFVPTLVPREHLITAVRLNSVQFQASRAIGPLFGAVALQFAGIGASFLVNAVTFVPVVFAVLTARPTQHIAPRAADHRVLAAMVDGFRFTWQRAPLRRVVLATFALSVFGQSIVQLTAAMSTEMYGHGSKDNAALVAAFGIGSVLSGISMITLGNVVPRSTTLRAGLALYVLGVALLPATTSYAMGIVGMFVCGLAHIPVATTLNTFVQGTVPDEYRGRVVSCYLTGVMLGMPLGSMLLGRLGDAIGMRETILLDAGVMAAMLAVIGVVYAGFGFIDADELEAPSPARG